MCELVADGNGFRLPIFRPAARVFGTLLAWSTSLGSLRNEPCPSVIVLFGNRSGLFPVRPALPHGPWFEPVSRHHGIRRANCAHCVINPKRCLFFNCFVVFWHSWKKCCCQRRECFPVDRWGCWRVDLLLWFVAKSWGVRRRRRRR